MERLLGDHKLYKEVVDTFLNYPYVMHTYIFTYKVRTCLIVFNKAHEFITKIFLIRSINTLSNLSINDVIICFNYIRIRGDSFNVFLVYCLVEFT